MKRIILSVLTMSALLCGCQKDHVSELAQGRGTIQATIEEISATRTLMDEDNNIRWSEGDQIVGFMKSTLGVKYQVTAASVGKTSASFEEVSSGGLNAGTELEHIIAYYPYSSSVSAAKSGSNYTLDVILPSEQTYAAESFGNGAMPMVAVSETNNITFRNVCGGMKLQLKGTQKVKSIKLQGKNNEKLSGAATVTAYTDETKPAITMSSSASTSVTLNCGSSVQLSESTATEFIIALPPVLFGSGFTVTVMDAENNTYTVETDKTNTVLRSSLLAMPPVKLGASGGEDSGDDDDELIIPVSYVNLNSTSLKLYEGDIAQLTATVGPKDATDKTVVWSSDNPAVASVDQTGLVTALAAGTAKVTAAAGGKSGTCSVTVSALAEATADYVDEYGVNHGPGVEIDGVVWAPVNCGYHKDDFKYGKLYQWGRKYGQGYSGEFWDWSFDSSFDYTYSTYSDSTIPENIPASVSLCEVQSQHNENKFYYMVNSPWDWCSPPNGTLWNSGTEMNPMKTEYDPCPLGWRIPTYAEIEKLCMNYSSFTCDDKDRPGRWFTGSTPYTATVSQLFLPAAGLLHYRDGWSCNRGIYGYYWSSRPSIMEAYEFCFHSSYNPSVGTSYRALGLSVRCVQE